jgi:hypothetical protein
MTRTTSTQKRIEIPKHVWRRLEALYKSKCDKSKSGEGEPMTRTLREFAFDCFLSGLDAEELINDGAL